MNDILGIAVVGAVLYFWLNSGKSKAKPVPVTEQYPKPIGPGLQGFTDVSRQLVLESDFAKPGQRWGYDQPFGTFAR